MAASLLFLLGVGQIDHLFGQGSGPVSVLYTTAAPAGACGNTQVRIVRSTGDIYGCVLGVWALIQTTGSSTDWNLITNKPSTFTPSTHATSHQAAGGDPLSLSASQVGLGNVNNTSDANKPISTATQTALDGKVATTTTVNGHALSTNVTVTKGDVGLGNVDNTSDAAKPVSTATQTALNGKVDTTRTINGQALSSNITLVKGDIGLGSVDNTSDLAKPISTATQTALDGKVPTTRTVNGLALSANITLVKGDLGLGNVDNTSDLNKPISTATQNAINGLNVFKGKGTYAAMTAAVTVAGDIWMQTDAAQAGLCGTGTGVVNSGFAVCVKDVNGVFQPIFATTSGTGGGGGSGGGTTTIYGGFTGGGTTRTITDATCSNASDDTAAVQAVLDLAVAGDTIDFTNTTNSCDISATGLLFNNHSNVRITASNATKPTTGNLRARAQITGTDEGAILDIDNCDSCLIDKIFFHGNTQIACAIFINNSTNFSIQNNEVSNFEENPLGAPFAGIKIDDLSDNFWVANNNIHDLGGTNGGEGLRGIWAGVGSRYVTNAHIIDNTVNNTGHTGIAVEGDGPIVTGNLISNTLVQGTCMKFIPRGASVDAVFDNNTCNRSYGAGLQVESDTVDATHIYVRNNQFILMSDQTVNGGQSFGVLYLSGGSGGGKNVVFTGNTLNQDRKVAAYNNTSNVLIQNNTILNGLGGFYTQIACEGNTSNVTIINSGVLDKQSGGANSCTTHTQDGIICTNVDGACQ